MKKTIMLGLVLFSSLAFADEAVIAVSGTAEKMLDPTHLVLRIEVWGKAPTAKQAQILSAQQMKTVRAQIENFKIKKEDIQTEQYQLNPEYHYRNNEAPQISGYRASQNLAVVVRKTEEVGSFLDALIVNGKSNTTGVSVQGMQWDTDKRKQAEMQLLGEAVRNGRLKAEELAKAAQVKIKGLKFLTDSRVDVVSPMPRASYGMAKSMMAAEAAPTEVLPGQIRVSVEVQAQYEIQ